uniref:Uncharacterized protein n=1 Tax=Nelumbo nucifera TaxID=4432 RepID=A0A822YPW1_NELNU|nr:TPA_asm: hypothetical protein HUJ06_004773 [Nelumbo nucifera]
MAQHHLNNILSCRKPPLSTLQYSIIGSTIPLRNILTLHPLVSPIEFFAWLNTTETTFYPVENFCNMNQALLFLSLNLFPKSTFLSLQLSSKNFNIIS